MRWMNKRFFTFLASFFLAVFLFVSIAPSTKAISVFTPFGGKVTNWNPAPSSCISNITVPIAIATFGAVWITVEKLKIGEPNPATVGVLRVNGFTIPALTNIYRNYTYFIPNSWVLGDSINICDLCDAASANIPFAKNICKIQAVKTFTGAVCKLIGGVGDCPITNLMHQVGVSSPVSAAVDSGTKEGLDSVAGKVKGAVCDTLGSIPLIGSLTGLFCK
ncbi:MAG: hypothetical protein UW92_C0040G0008 [Candidatus Jorgensenbacteria bacterium GW2011_GWA2_45_13]|uniref:Uncharacterized protein n=1 Tax=Candidatus Jorgensenbacteria bacterium GW2011_GWA2_45_13 TaxID=1618662 RepID=A0A0G1L3D0_9BACT|nr:MAG: hypothetical protein UW92_C0040G0008 [Candidatus Jorgensenbacteria bacterium GW2011_GWA2_45_13]